MLHESSLRALFNVHARVARPTGARKLGLLLGLLEWKLLMRRLELLQGDLTERDATLCFVTSRMAVTDGAGSACDRTAHTCAVPNLSLSTLSRAYSAQPLSRPSLVRTPEHRD
jgi:hypothetical protein